MKTTVIYHSADFDGIFCREIAKLFMPDATLIGWNFGDPLITFPEEGMLYVLDLSPDCLGPKWKDQDGNHNRLIWIDHHKSSIEKWLPQIPGYRIDGVAACRLAWQWFALHVVMEQPLLPAKQDYVERSVNEPLAVRLAGEYDIWDKCDPRAETFQYALRIEEPDWNMLFHSDSFTNAMVLRGRDVQKYAQVVDASICKSSTWLMQWEGLTFLCVNHARFNSLLFAAKDMPETGHDALLGFKFNGKLWTVSLYHAAHRKDLDLSQIAIKYGGGGHRGACGFTCDKLPFINH